MAENQSKRALSRPLVATFWRILVQEPRLEMRSGNYRALDGGRSTAGDEARRRVSQVFEAGGVLDEVVILFEPDPGENGPPFTQQKRDMLAPRTAVSRGEIEDES